MRVAVRGDRNNTHKNEKVVRYPPAVHIMGWGPPNSYKIILKLFLNPLIDSSTKDERKKERNHLEYHLICSAVSSCRSLTRLRTIICTNSWSLFLKPHFHYHYKTLSSSSSLLIPKMGSSSCFYASSNGCLIFLLVLVAMVVTTSAGNFYQDFDLTWGDHRAKIFNGGQLLSLSLDQASGSGFQSKKEYLFGRIDMQLKLVSGNSAGTVTAYYVCLPHSQTSSFQIMMMIFTQLTSKNEGKRKHIPFYFCSFLFPFGKPTVVITTVAFQKFVCRFPITEGWNFGSYFRKRE